MSIELKIEGVLGKLEVLECKLNHKDKYGSCYEVKSHISTTTLNIEQTVLDGVVSLLNMVFEKAGKECSDALLHSLPERITDRIMYGYHKATDEAKE
jgi:hypothetical protein